MLMILRVRNTALVAVVCTVMTSLATAADLRTEFEKLYANYAAAVRAQDAPTYMAYFTDDFTMVDPTGKVHDATEMQKYQAVNAKTTKAVKNYEATVEAINQLSNGDVAVIVLQKYVRVQSPMGSAEEHEISTSVVQREIWTKRKGEWKIRRTEELLTGPVFMDGKYYDESRH